MAPEEDTNSKTTVFAAMNITLLSRSTWTGWQNPSRADTASVEWTNVQWQKWIKNNRECATVRQCINLGYLNYVHMGRLRNSAKTLRKGSHSPVTHFLTPELTRTMRVSNMMNRYVRLNSFYWTPYGSWKANEGSRKLISSTLQTEATLATTQVTPQRFAEEQNTVTLYDMHHRLPLIYQA